MTLVALREAVENQPRETESDLAIRVFREAYDGGDESTRGTNEAVQIFRKAYGNR